MDPRIQAGLELKARGALNANQIAALDELVNRSGGDQQAPTNLQQGTPMAFGPARVEKAVSTTKPEGDGFFGVVEPALTMASGIVAEPIAGIAGTVQALNPFAEQGAGADAVQSTRDALTYRPRTQAGESGLQTVGETLEPLAEVLQSAEKGAGDYAFELTGSPAVAAAATTLPTLALEALGLAGVKGTVRGVKGAVNAPVKVVNKAKDALTRRAKSRAIVEAAPDVEVLKSTASALYKEIDDVGSVVKSQPVTDFVHRTIADVKRKGLNKTLTPKTHAIVKELKSISGKEQTLTEIDTLRRIANSGTTPTIGGEADAMLAGRVVQHIDDFLDSMDTKSFKTGAKQGPVVITKLKTARDMWGRARRHEILQDAFDIADNAADPLMSVKSNFRKILNSKKRAKMFNKEELDAIRNLVHGSKPEALAEAVGKLGFREGGSLIGGAIGFSVGTRLLGKAGGVAVPIIGTYSRRLALSLTRDKGKFAQAVARSGRGSQDIVDVYFKHTPKAKRNTLDLAELLAKRSDDVELLTDSPIKTVREAALQARGRQVLEAAAGLSPAGAIKATEEQ